MTAVGALVLIEFVNGTQLDLPSSSQIVLDTDVFDGSLATEAGAGELTAEQIQEMIARVKTLPPSPKPLPRAPGRMWIIRMATIPVR